MVVSPPERLGRAEVRAMVREPSGRLKPMTTLSALAFAARMASRKVQSPGETLQTPSVSSRFELTMRWSGGGAAAPAEEAAFTKNGGAIRQMIIKTRKLAVMNAAMKGIQRVFGDMATSGFVCQMLVICAQSIQMSEWVECQPSAGEICAAIDWIGGYR